MKVLMIEPGKAPYEAELDGSLESMQEAVGGGIEGYYYRLLALHCISGEKHAIDRKTVFMLFRNRR